MVTRAPKRWSAVPLYEDVVTGDSVVQGYTVTEPEGLAQVQNVLDGESFVRAPRAKLTRLAPNE
ncbi:hypothetical protein [Streptomyces sp. 142MFCol3.1]|uniref:hypothetical protein n=1 Tax=Streptomyces sp. 142MFCol3.1 TaxID=1172179 RepID=UPI000410304B|nr:hypothetical protein [Streptomyces sp. 142MFCol3.1]